MSSSRPKQIKCVLLNNVSETQLLTLRLDYEDSFGSLTYLSNEIYSYLTSEYPGVKEITLYFSNFLYKKAFGTDLSEKYIEINDELVLLIIRLFYCKSIQSISKSLIFMASKSSLKLKRLNALSKH